MKFLILTVLLLIAWSLNGFAQTPLTTESAPMQPAAVIVDANGKTLGIFVSSVDNLEYGQPGGQMRFRRKNSGRLGADSKQSGTIHRVRSPFLGKRAWSIMLGQPDVNWGRPPTTFAGTMAWVLPHPSGLNRMFPLDALVKAYSEFRTALFSSPPRIHP